MKTMKIDPIGLTQPAHGVIATRPATAPDAAPSAVDVPERIFSAISQPSIAVAVAVFVLTQAALATLSAASSEPALNPNQPNHSNPAQSSTHGMLWPRICSRGQPRRLPSSRHIASPAA